MGAALTQLLLLRFRGGLRYRLRQFATPRGAVFILIALSVAWLYLGTDLLTPGNELGRVAREETGRFREGIGNFMPLGLFGTFIFSLFASTGPAIHFSQNEINFLFAGPFSRRSLILYKCGAFAAGALLSAAIVTMLIPQRASALMFAFSGAFMTMLFIQLSNSAVRVFIQVYADGWMMRCCRPAALVLLVSAAAATLYATAMTGGAIMDLLVDLRRSSIGVVVLAPFTVFAELFLAKTVFPDLAWWGSCALAINSALMLVIVILGGQASDRSLSESERLSNRWARMRQGASFWSSSRTNEHSMRRLPVPGGLGPIIWRQAINAVRNSGRVIAVFFVIAILAGPVFDIAPSTRAVHGLIGLVYFFITFLVPRTLVCDFRGDIRNMELYKALPIAPWKLCVGQLVMPVLVSSAISVVLLLGTMLFVEGNMATALLALTAFTVPFSLLLYGFENVIFLLFPTKLLPVGRVDFDFLGRTLIDFVVKTIIVVTAVVAAGAAGRAVFHVSGESWWWFGIVSWIALAGMALLTIPLVSLAFRRFNVSQTVD